ncbi:MAG: sigma-70 family RNA polymerase sigma factor [Clostridia bacterium]|nr:sigma-70 family RNA polymerase sigma factor [Clostridia bacterium]
MQNKKDEELLLEYKQGNQQALNELCNRYKSIVKFYTRNLFLLGLDDEDLIQEGLMGFVNAANTYDNDKSLFKTYAHRCIKNSLYSAIKKNAIKYGEILKNSSSLEELNELGRFAPSLDTPEDEFLNKEKSREFRFKIYSNLSKRESLVLDLYLEGLSYQEIAEKLACSVKAVDGALTRAKAKIKKCMEK